MRTRGLPLASDLDEHRQKLSALKFPTCRLVITRLHLKLREHVCVSQTGKIGAHPISSIRFPDGRSSSAVNITVAPCTNTTTLPMAQSVAQYASLLFTTSTQS